MSDIEEPGGLRPPLAHRLSEREWLLIDAAVAAVLLIAGVLRVDLPRAGAAPGVPGWAVTLLVVFGTAPVALRRRRPMAVLMLVAGATGALTGLGRPPLALDGATGLAAYAMSLRCERRASALVFALVEVALIAAVVVAIARGIAGPYVVAPMLVTAVAWFAGDGARVRRRYVEIQAARARQRLRDQVDSDRRAVREERLRIARELHDVLAHSLTVMTVQAGVARRLASPADELDALESIEQTGRSAQSELRIILGLLRDEDHEPPALAPAPGLGDLDELTSNVREAGLPVELHISGERRPLSLALELSLYRIVQESLTNVVKHAAGAATTVDLVFGRHEITLEVFDLGPARGGNGARTHRAASPGQGIIGMRERIAAFGGTLLAEPLPGRGFRVLAHVPLGSEVS